MGFNIQLAAVIPAAVALLVGCRRDITRLLLVLGTKEQGCSKIVHASTEQIYVVNTMEVDRLGEERKDKPRNRTDKEASIACPVLGKAAKVPQQQ